MAVSPLLPESGLTGTAFPAPLTLMVAPWREHSLAPGQAAPENGGWEALSRPAEEVRHWRNETYGGGNYLCDGGLQELPWKDFFSDPIQWGDNRRSNGHPDSRHKKSKGALWLNRWYKPAWVDLELDAQVGGGVRRPPLSIYTSVQMASGRLAAHELELEIEACRKLCKDGPITVAVNALNLLVQRGCSLDTDIFYWVIKRCIARKDLVLGRRIHALSIEIGYEENAFLATHLIGLYASRGKLEEAMEVFSKVTLPSPYMWSSIIFAYTRHGEPTQAIRLYRQMCESTIKPDNRIFVAVLKACASAGDLAVGKDVHAHIRASVGEPDIFVQTCLVDMYAKCGSLEEAQRVFDTLSQKNVVTWTAMIAGYAQQGMGHEALMVYTAMQQEDITPPPDFVTFVSLLQACASVGVAALQQGKELHSQIEERGLQDDVIVGTSLVNMYSKCGSLEDARRVFDSLSQKNMVTWTAMIAGYVQQGVGQEALGVYSRMQQEALTPPDPVTFVCLLQACASVAALHQGMELHAQIEERGLQADVAVGNSLVNMYAKCGSLEHAQRVFDSLSHKDVVAWNTMIGGYVQQGMAQEALALYTGMEQNHIIAPNSVTFACLLQACASVTALPLGKQLHVQIVERGLQADVIVGNSLVNMYAKCGSLEDARRVFDRLPRRDVVTWNAMIAGYARQGMAQEALNTYNSMQQEGSTAPDPVTFVCLLQACASVAALPIGKQLHAQIEERGVQADVVVGPSLVNMYAKCGSLEDAERVFESLPKREIVAWSALIAGYARQGDSDIVFDLVDRMQQVGIQPDGVTFLSVLTVCSHAGLVDKGRKYFEAMSTDYGMTPTIDHYICMIDLMGRAGNLEEAIQFVTTMPFQPNGSVWLTLLAACRKWTNVEVGRQAFEFAVRLDEKDSAPYVLMSNIYAGAQMWEEAKTMQARRVKCGARKQPGRSWWADMGGVVHSFVVGDRSHPETEGIYARLQLLILKIKKEGYVPHLASSLRDTADNDKEAELCRHSEKLAIAHALNKTPDGTTIRIVKNLRVCVDCHIATAYISKVEKRTIICRDAGRFHVYKEGKCSCGDYW